jgi:WD40 repeat protein
MDQWTHLITPLRLSPDATQLVVPQPDGGATWLLDLHGAAPVKMAEQALSVTWSPNGRQVTFYVPDTATPETLYTQQVSPTLQPAQPLAHLADKIIAAAWSPSGDYIAVALSTGDLEEDGRAYIEIIAISAGTGDLKRLGQVLVSPTEGSTSDLAWSADGQEIWYLRGQVAFSLSGTFFPLVTPPMPFATRVWAFAPDKTRIAYVAADQRTLVITGTDPKSEHLTVNLPEGAMISTLFWIDDQLFLTTGAPNTLTSIWYVNPETGAALMLCDTVYFIGLWPDLVERYTNLALHTNRLPLPEPGPGEAWLTYTGEQLQLRFTYPAEWMIWQDAQTNTVILSNFTFSRPDGWDKLAADAFWLTVQRLYVPGQDTAWWLERYIPPQAEEVLLGDYVGWRWYSAPLPLYESVVILLDDHFIVALRKSPAVSVYDTVFTELLNSLEMTRTP